MQWRPRRQWLWYVGWERRSAVAESEVGSGQQSAGRLAVVLYTHTSKVDGSVDLPAAGEPVLKAGGGSLAVYDCKVYDRLQKDKFIFGMSQMEVLMDAVEVLLPRDAVTKEGVF